jgi:hypothetical protein
VPSQLVDGVSSVDSTSFSLDSKNQLNNPIQTSPKRKNEIIYS